VYFYRMRTQGADGKPIVLMEKMLLMK